MKNINKIDNIIPDGKWIFNEAVTNCFDNMIERSIPEYQNMRKLVYDLGKKFVQSNSDILDLGCSTGIALEPFINSFYETNTFVGIEISTAMFSAVTAKFKKEISEDKVKIYNCDLTKFYPNTDACVILSILTLQFIEPKYRLKILKNVFNSLKQGGCFILVEKLVSDTEILENYFTDLYYNMKKKHGYTEEQINRKRLSLNGVMKPLTATKNERLLRKAGFVNIECFWRHLNFAGWIAIK